MSVRRIRLALRRSAGEEAGLGMTEILVALMVFAVIATAAAYGILNALTLTGHSRSNETATSIASSDIDVLRLKASASANGIFSVVTGSAPSQKIGGTTYSIARSTSWQNTSGASGACGTGSGTLQYKNVTDTVSWVASNGVTRSVTVSTAIAPLSNINSDTTGTIIVTVVGANHGQPVPGLKVSITPVSTGTGTTLSIPPQDTDSSGCSFGLLVTPGTYTVTASLSGYLDPSQHAIATTLNAAPVSVVAGQNILAPLVYDQAATFPLTYPAGAALPTNLPISFYNPNSPLGTSTFTAASNVNAYPFSDGYTIIAGTYVYTAATSTASCFDTNPAAWTTTRADGAVATASVPVAAAAGTTAQSTAVPMGTFSVSGVNNQYITAVTSTTSGPGDPGCAIGQSLKFGKAGGGTTTLALPFGTWTLYCSSTSTSTGSACSSSILGTITGGILNLTGGKPVSVTVDPRMVPAP